MPNTSPISLRSSLVTMGCIAALGALGCSDNPKAKGELMLAVSTDMSIDRDLDRVDVIVERENGKIYNEPIDLYPKPGGLFTPGTFAVVAGDSEGESVRVSIVARRGGTSRVVRELSTTIPRERVGVVAMPVQWLCEGEVTASEKHSKCFGLSATGKHTCGLGRCVDNEVSEADVGNYDVKDLYGGYPSALDAARAGACFDVLRCYDASQRVTNIDLDSCTFPRPEGAKTLNIGLVIGKQPDGTQDGHCNASSGICYIPLDESKAFGWVDNAGAIQLPGGVCDRLADGRVLAVVTTRACDTKKVTTPLCGPWLGPTGSNDRDEDGIPDATDNCPSVPNPSQVDGDADQIGDACDFAESVPDADSDGVPDSTDNCVTVSNQNQLNADADALGDVCDPDQDGDGVVDTQDPEPRNPFVPDSDLDGLWNTVDNCPAVANLEQLDTDQDGIGDSCDSDIDADGIVNKLDNCSLASNASQADCDGNGVGDACDQCPSEITLTKPQPNTVLNTRIFQASGNVGSLKLSELTIDTRSAVTGHQFSQTVPVQGGAFSSGNLILNAGQNIVTGTSCNCQSKPVTVTANVNPADILVTLTWDQPDTDVDLFVYEPTDVTTACYFDAACATVVGTTPLGAVLDTDNTTGYGPENYSLSSAGGANFAPGTYRVRAHYFRGVPTVAYDLRVLLNENTADEQVTHYTGQLTQSSRDNTLPSSTGIGWVDIAEIVCAGTPNRCTVRSSTTPYVSPITGAGGASGIGGANSNGGSNANGGANASGGANGNGGGSGSLGVPTGGRSTGGGGAGNIPPTQGGSASGGTTASGGALNAAGSAGAAGLTVAVDSDKDSIADFNDNCEFVANLDQADVNDDGIGDVCECGASNYYVHASGQCVFYCSATTVYAGSLFGPSSLTSYNSASGVLTIELDPATPQPDVTGVEIQLWDYAVTGLAPVPTMVVPASRVYHNRVEFDLVNYGVSSRGISHAAIGISYCDGYTYDDLTIDEPPAQHAEGQHEIIRAPLCYELSIGSALGTNAWQGYLGGQGFDHRAASNCAGFGEDVGLLWSAPQAGTYQFSEVRGGPLTLLDASCTQYLGCAKGSVIVTRAMNAGDQVVIVLGGSSPASPGSAQLVVASGIAP